MADTYTKLFSSITESTVWGEPYPTRIVWVAMLAMADAAGNVYAAVPGLARRANVTVQEAQAALDAFLAPDPWSRTPDNDGRRIEVIDGGWRLTNHAKYRAIRGADDRREAKREWDRANRPSGHARASQSEQSDASPSQSDETRQSGPTSSNTSTISKEQKATVQPTAAQPVPDGLPADIEAPAAPTPRTPRAKPKTANRFAEWWAAYPVKKGKAAALKTWKAKDLDGQADELIAHCRRMERDDDQWRRGFIPHGSTYLNGERWTDEPLREGQVGAPAPPLPVGAKAAMAPSESKLQHAISWAQQQYQRGDLGQGDEALAKLREAVDAARRKYAEE